MIRKEDRCVGCTEAGLPCMGSSCVNRNINVLYCDCCGDEAEKLYQTDMGELCGECINENLSHFFEEVEQ